MRFAALRAPWYKGYLAGGSLMMGADHVEHAITYFVMWQLFESPVLAGFAVISHWVPQLLFAIPFGALADRFDCRRLIQLGAACFMLASAGWAVLIATNTLEPWHCVVLLILHGLAGTFWGPADQLMLYDIVGPKELPSAVRLMATGLNLGMLVGPAIGAALLFTVGAAWGMAINVLLYLPFVIYLLLVPYDGHSRVSDRPAAARFRDVLGVLREVPRHPPILAVMVLQALVGLFIGSAVVTLLPEFGQLLGLEASGLAYGLLLVAMATGAVAAGIGLEAIGRIRVSVRLAITATIVFAAALVVFAISRSFALSLVVLVVAGMANLTSSSTSQAIVQLEAPPDRRGRFLGASAMASNGSRVGSGILIGALGSWLGVTWAVGIDAALLLASAAVLLALVLVRRRRMETRHTAPVEPSEPEALGEN
ncbi:MFS transporter [Protaetiibacter intestinalis]|uniref:MFS transporter n=1 Tax=Protaetiibacter intestinalis TaxID=2419774 RepID=A0A387B8H7_9MICO|nr:MFS transporter [Protaetiibacter intestinalis]AYF97495.1 MFS transporter [Protaetiibacter intestinalis]